MLLFDFLATLMFDGVIQLNFCLTVKTVPLLTVDSKFFGGLTVVTQGNKGEEERKTMLIV